MDKGIGILLEAWKKLNSSDAELWLVGTGDAGVIQLARGVAGVQVIGKLGPDDLREAYQSASVFVFPTFNDGFGMVLLEAMASGLPVVATRVGGNPVLVEDEMTGLLVRPGDPDALAKAIIRLVEDPMLARRLGASAYDVVRSRFGVDRMLSRVQALYERALSGQARRAPALSN